MRVLVIGGGIAGTTTALALRKAGIEAEVHEEYERDSGGVGAWLTLASNGIDALATLGLAEAVAATGFATPEMRMYGHTGRQLVAFPFGTPRADGFGVRTVRRAELYGILRSEAIDSGIPVHFGHRLVGTARDADGRIEATFADGTRATGDLLVGADGLRSTVRALIDPEAPPARYTGLLNTGGFARDVVLDPEFRSEPGVVQFRFGRRCFLGYTVAPDGGVWWFANPPSARELDRSDLAAITEDDWRERLLDLFAGDHLPARALIDSTDEVFRGWNTYDFPRLPIWHRERMIVIGDAAHAMSPAAGQGASMALEDAVVLARALRDRASIEEAFASYEAERRPRVERVVALGKRNGDGKALGATGRIIRDHLVMPLLARRARRVGAAPDEWLYGHHIDWEQSAGVSRR